MDRYLMITMIEVLLCLSVVVSCTRQDQRTGEGEAAMVNPAGQSEQRETAVFAAGCFWGVQAAFDQIEGVIATRVGYTGGTAPEPTYKQVCTGRTGHAEAVEVTYDPRIIGYDELLAAFWAAHDPTTPNRQGPDVGTQYRSAIFVHDEAQRRAAEASRDHHQNRLDRKIVTEIVPAGPFYPAEEYHQKYLFKRGLRSCHLP